MTNVVARWAQHQFDKHLFKKSNHFEHQWSLFTAKDIVFKVQRDDNNAQWMESLYFELIRISFGFLVRYPTIQACKCFHHTKVIESIQIK